MKKGFAVQLLSILTVFSFAQEDTTLVLEPTLRTNTISTSALYTMFGMLNVNYGKIINNGKNEYQIMVEHLVMKTHLTKMIHGIQA